MASEQQASLKSVVDRQLSCICLGSSTGWDVCPNSRRVLDRPTPLICLTLFFFPVSVKPSRLRDVIFPTVTCPSSHTVTLNQETLVVKLDGAETKDNTGIQLLEYRAEVGDGTATYEEPDRLLLTRASVGRTYTVQVITKDLDDNEATCNYTISVEGECAFSKDRDSCYRHEGRFCTFPTCLLKIERW